MLKILRQRGIQRKIFIGLALMIIPSFLFWGVMVNEEDQKTAGPLGRIGNRAISVKDYLDSYRATQHQMQFMFGDRWTEMRRFVNLKGEAWDRILLLEEARRRGVKTTDREVVDWIAAQAAFQRKGKYYPELYRLAVRDYLRMEPRDFEEETRKTLTVQKLSKQVIDTAAVGDAELRELYDGERATPDLDYAVAADPNIEAALKRLNDLKPAIEKDGFEPAVKAAGLLVQHFQGFKPDAQLPGIGSGSMIARQVSLMKEGEVSGAIAISGAAAIVRIAQKTAPDDAAFQKDKEEFRKEILSRKSQEKMGELLEKLREKLQLNTEKMREIFPEEEEKTGPTP